MPPTAPYKDDTNIPCPAGEDPETWNPLYYTYKLVGYSNSPNSTKIVEYWDREIVTDNSKKYYAVWSHDE